MKALALALAVECVVLAASVPRHSPDVDEAWFAEEAWFEARDGFPHSNFFKGFVHEDVRVVVHHYLFIAAESMVIRRGGFGLFTVRVVPIGSTILLLVLVALFQWRLNGASAREILLTLLVLLLTPQVFRSAKLARPDMLMALFGFASFASLRAGWERASPWLVVVAGVCAGAAMLAHLNGLVFVATGTIMLLVARRWLRSVAFLAAAALVFSPYAFNALQHLDLFREQIRSPLIAYKTELSLLQPLLNLSREHMRLFRKPDIIFATVLFLLCAAALFRKGGFAFRYTLILILIIGAALADKGLFYSVYAMPFEAMIIARTLAAWSAVPRRLMPVLAAATAAFGGWGVYAQARDLRDKSDLVSVNREIGAMLPAEAWTVVPLEMAFDELPSHFFVSITLVPGYRSGHATTPDLAAYCDAMNAAYAVVYRNAGNATGFAAGEPVAGKLFDTVREDPRYLVLRRR